MAVMLVWGGGVKEDGRTLINGDNDNVHCRLTLRQAPLEALWCIISFNPRNCFMWQVLLLSSFHVSDDRGPERLCNVAKVTELVGAGARLT